MTKVDIISGFLGTGKTTFLNKYLPMLPGLTAVVENEFGEVGLDGALLQEDIPVKELSAGCICCTLALDLKEGIIDIAKKYNGKTFVLEKNKLGWKSVKFNFVNGSCSIEVVDAQDKSSIIGLGYNEWVTSQLSGYPHYSISAKGRFSGITGPFYTGSCYAWVGNELHTKIHYVNWISSLKLVVKFEGNSIVIDGQENFTSKPFVMKGVKK